MRDDRELLADEDNPAAESERYAAAGHGLVVTVSDSYTGRTIRD